MGQVDGNRLADVAPEIERYLLEGGMPPPQFSASDIRCETVQVAMRDGTRLATDLYFPPTLPAQVVVTRAPFGRDFEAFGIAAALSSLARRGYVVVSQDCRGTGDSEPDDWDYWVYELEDGYDLVEWISNQEWCSGFIGSFGGSYTGITQWCMSTHPAMSAIVPANSSLGVAINTAHIYMFVNAYARVVGKGDDKLDISIFDMERHFEKETLAGGYFNEPLYAPFSEQLLVRFPELADMTHSEARRWLWEQYCKMSNAERAEFIQHARGVEHITMVDMESMSEIFGHRISHARHTIPHTNTAEMSRRVMAPPLMATAWYDWSVHDALATYQLLRQEARDDVAARTRIIISPRAHNKPGYRLGVEEHPELLRQSNTVDQVGLLMRWYQAVEEGSVDSWPSVIYYLMGANEWRVASDWPVPEATQHVLYLGPEETLSTAAPEQATEPDHYTYDPDDPTPTMGGSIVSFLYTPGSADVREAQARDDVLVYTTPVLEQDLDVVGHLRLILYASSSAVDTDFVARLTDVMPDGRAIQIQSGMLRARHRDIDGEPELLEPGSVYRFEIDMWATAMRFKAGHRLRLDICSADFPRWDRNANRGGEPGPPVPATQSIYHDSDHPSHLLIHVLEGGPAAG